MGPTQIPLYSALDFIALTNEWIWLSIWNLVGWQIINPHTNVVRNTSYMLTITDIHVITLRIVDVIFCKGRQPVLGKETLNKTLLLQDRGFCNRLVNCWSKKVLLILANLKGASEWDELVTERELMNEWEPANSLPSRGGVTSSSLLRGVPISKHVTVWEEQEYGHGSRRSPKPRRTVLARVSSNLLDWTGFKGGTG
jgi:hypothetical protein